MYARAPAYYPHRTADVHLYDILTDLFHLADGHRNNQVPEWFDLALILSFAWNGLLLGVLSIRQMERTFIPRASVFHGWLFLYPVMAKEIPRWWRKYHTPALRHTPVRPGTKI